MAFSADSEKLAVREDAIPYDLANQAEAGLILLLFLLAGALAMLPLTQSLLQLWHEDPLRSFGALIPFIACGLMIRGWRQLGWQRNGTAWGLLPIVVCVLLARLAGTADIAFHFGRLALQPLQPSLLLAGYFSGVLLLLGGMALWRRCLFPLALLLCVNPVPHFLTMWVDLPMQTAAAHVARSFAHVLGLSPTGAQLDLMFTPRFGMTIVPGCNGMRGAATMAYVALLIGYVRGFRPGRLAAVTVGAGVLGYVLNFLRLCILVIYYWLGLHSDTVRNTDGALVDYIIGGTIFLLVSTLAGSLWLGGTSKAQTAPEHPVDWPAVLRHRRLGVAAALLLVAALSEVPAAFAIHNDTSPYTPEAVVKLVPKNAGTWVRGQMFTEGTSDKVAWVWFPYAKPGGETVYLGVWLGPRPHFMNDSLRVMGAAPLWQGTLDTSSGSGAPVRFATMTDRNELTGFGSGTIAAEKNAGPTLEFMAETICQPAQCSYTAPEGVGQHFITVRVGPVAMQSDAKLSMLLRIRHVGAADISSEQRGADAAAAADLMRNLDTRSLAVGLGHY